MDFRPSGGGGAIRVACAALCLASAYPNPSLAALSMTRIGEYPSAGAFITGAEVVDWRGFMAGPTRRLTAYTVNSVDDALDIISLDNPAAPIRTARVVINRVNGDLVDGPTSVAVDPLGRGVAVAVVARPPQDPGWVVFYDLAGNELAFVQVGAMPDMVKFTPDGQKVLTANEGEPAISYVPDPAGSISIIDVSGGLVGAVVTTAQLVGIPEVGPVRHFGPNAASPELDFEPEYIAITSDSTRAFISIQENNAIAELDLTTDTVTTVYGLGYKDHSLATNALDPSDSDGVIAIAPWPVFGMYQPDGIYLYEAGGATYLLTANEGDTRDYPAFSEEIRVSRLLLEAPLSPSIQVNTAVGRLQVTNRQGDADGNGAFSELYAFGARSFSVWDVSDMTTPVFDSGSDLEDITASLLPGQFNCDQANNTFDDRSDNKGPEPETVVVGEVCGRPYAFIGLERIGGVMVYAFDDPTQPVFETYITSRNFAVTDGDPNQGGIGPEGLAFVPRASSPSDKPLLLVANEVSGTLDIWEMVDNTCPSCVAFDFTSTTSAAATGDCELTVSWDAAVGDGPIRYDVYRSTTCPATIASGIRVATGLSGTSYVDSVDYGDAFCYIVEARDSCGSGPVFGTNGSSAVATAGDTTAPVGGTAPTATVGANCEVDLDWTVTDPCSGVAAFDIHRSASMGFIPSAASFIATSPILPFGEAPGPGVWFYVIVARDAAGNEQNSPEMTIDSSTCGPSCLAASLTVRIDLVGAKVAVANPGVHFYWAADGAASEYHLNSVTDKTLLAGDQSKRPPVGVGAIECDGPTPDCIDQDALTVADALVFYQALSACGPSGLDEGPR